VTNVQGLGSLPTVPLERKIGKLSQALMGRLKDALAFALDLERASE
jgi:mRNA interferase MazF